MIQAEARMGAYRLHENENKRKTNPGVKGHSNKTSEIHDPPLDIISDIAAKNQHR